MQYEYRWWLICSQPAHATERKLYRPGRTQPSSPLECRRRIANLVSAQFSHDAAGRLAHIRHQKADGSALAQYSYQRDAKAG